MGSLSLSHISEAPDAEALNDLLNGWEGWFGAGPHPDAAACRAAELSAANRWWEADWFTTRGGSV